MGKLHESGWTGKFLNLDFRDKRLNQRGFRIMDVLSVAPDKSIWTTSGDRVEVKAIYRFFNNEVVSYDDLLRSIAGATVEKLRQIQPRRVLLIQDTTAVSFGLRKNILGMDYYCDSEQRGMLVFSCLALTGGEIPVGLLQQEAYTRDSRRETLWTKEERKSLPIEHKESFRWLTALREYHAELPADMERLTVYTRAGGF